MKSISLILKNIRKLLPYFILIAIYFFFINLEARKDNNKNIRNSDKNNIIPESKTSIDDQKFKIKIPVIPYKN
tara:strand:+ start:1125 stop:1343 length:219 start_codon:yes stop_codon:yes gene_type:complete